MALQQRSSERILKRVADIDQEAKRLGKVGYKESIPKWVLIGKEQNGL
jgi:hypothetical protein